MNTITIAFLLTFFAGLSTLLGMVFVLIPFSSEKKVIASSLAFASGVMLCVSVTDLIPEGIVILDEYMNGFFVCFFSFLFVMIGILIASLLSRRISCHLNDSSLYKVGIIAMIVIILHNVPEGIATFLSTTRNVSIGISLAVAIALHNIPEGISIGVPIYYSTRSKSKAFFYTFIAALSEPFGALLTYLFLLPIINQLVLGFLFLFVAGVMIYISIVDLFPSSYQEHYYSFTYFFFIFGIIVMLLKFLIL